MKKLFLFFSLLLMFNASLPTSYAEESYDVVAEGNGEPQFFQIKADILDRKKEQGDNWGVKVSSEVTMQLESDKDVDITYTLRKQSEDKYNMVDLEAAPIHKKIKMGKKVKLDKIFDLHNLAPGQYELEIQVLSKQSDDETWGDRKQVLFTVTEGGVSKKWINTYIPSLAPSQSVESDSNVAPYISHDSEEYKYQNENQIEVSSDNQNPLLATSTLSGNWKFYYKNALKNIRNAKVEVRYRDQFFTWRTIGTTYTDLAGNWSISYTNPNGNYWEVIISTQSSFANVKNPNNGNSTWSSNIFYSDLNNGGNINLNTTNGTDVNNAFTIYDDVVTTKNYLTLAGKDPGSANNIYFDSVNDQTSNQSSGSLFLYKNTPGKSTPMHELSHLYMYNLYGSMPSTGSCTNHQFSTSTNTGCAWVEGWASIVPLIFGNGVYTYTSGSTINLENTSSFASGDTVEGRVVGSLWDLYDTANDGTDTRSYSFDAIYRAMWDGGIKNTFSDWWTKWKALGYSTDAKDCLSQNSIIYS